VVQVRGKLIGGLVLTNPFDDVNPGRPKSRDSFTIDLRVRIRQGNHHPSDARCFDRIAAGRCSPMVRAWLQRDD
jgi:hypothetical protein